MATHFPHPLYLFRRAEYEHWNKEVESTWKASKSLSSRTLSVILASRRAGSVDFIETDRSCRPRATPRHVNVANTSASQNGFNPGDVVHHPYRLAHPVGHCDPLFGRG